MEGVQAEGNHTTVIHRPSQTFQHQEQVILVEIELFKYSGFEFILL
jgi:hypothetical protein